MDKLWTGRFSKQLDDIVNDFNSSIRFDARMYKQDIMGSMAHAKMLAKTGIIPSDAAEQIVDGLSSILSDIENGKLPIDFEAEDIHSFIESELTKRIGDAGRMLHTARSRNDQVAVDFKLFLRGEADEIHALLAALVKVITKQAKAHAKTIMPGYTHLQRAQPVTFGHVLIAYAMMFLRDISRLADWKKRMNTCPLGCGALAGTTHPIDREFTARELGFSDWTRNSIDGISDRDYAIELASSIAMIMMHLSRFSEEIILWCSWEFKFIELDDAYATGSSMMPQKKNPDVTELVRGRAGRSFGNLMALFTMMKGLPLSYNKDMQEDKEAIFDSIDTVKACLGVFAPMLDTMTVHEKNMRDAAASGFINATDCADYLVKKGLPFRTAYKLTGELVRCCMENAKTFETLTLEEYKRFSALFKDDVYEAINLDNCVKKRVSQGGTAIESVYEQIEWVESKL